MENSIVKVAKNLLFSDTKEEPINTERIEAEPVSIAIITKCAYDKGKAHICVEHVGGKYRQGVMHQLVLSAEDVIEIIERKKGTAYIPPLEAFK